MNKTLKWIIIGVVALILLMVGLKKAGIMGKEEEIVVSSEKAAKRTIIETVNASGKVYPEVEVKVSPDISGEITDLAVQEGDSVRRGQVLARIYADILNTQRDAAAAEVQRQQAVTSNATEGLGSFRAQIELAQKTFDRQKKLLEDKVISRAEFEQADQQLKTLQANYNAALQGIRANNAGISSAQAQLQKANKDIGRTAVIAPRDGVVSLLNVKKGERVVGSNMMAGTEMLRIADMSKFEVRVDVSESDIVKVHVGDSATIEVDAYNNRKFKGLVYQIASSNNGAAASQTAVTGNEVTNYKVYIRILASSYQDLLDPNRPKAFPFRPGMSATADIQTRTENGGLSVPINAVTTREKGTDKTAEEKRKEDEKKKDGEVEDGESSHVSDGELQEVVFVLQKDGTVKKQVVKVGIQDINYILILSGLKEGDEVITGPYNTISKTLKEKDKVKVVDKDKLFDKK